MVEGTIRLRDPICIPALDGTNMSASVGGFDAYRKNLGFQVSSGQHADPFNVMVGFPAPSQREIAMGVAAGCPAEGFHNLAVWTLRHRPARLIHDRGPDGLGLPCGECTWPLYRLGLYVLHSDFEPALRDLCHHPDPYIAGRAREIIGESMSEEEYEQWREQQAAALRKSRRWKFWRRK
jgi:hypothetical protein